VLWQQVIAKGKPDRAGSESATAYERVRNLDTWATCQGKGAHSPGPKEEIPLQAVQQVLS